MAIIYGNKSVTDVAPSLDLRFSYRKDLVDTMSGKNLIDFSRSSSATYVDADGVIKSSSVNQPRFDHDPMTGESLGLLIEEARTNNQTYSQHFDKWSRYNVTPIPNAAIAPDGSFTATALIENSGINPAFYLQGAYPGGSTVSGSAISIFCKEIPGSSKRYLCLGMSNPGAFTRCSYIVVDISAKTYVLRQDGFQTFGTNIKIESFANEWIRISGIFNGYLDNAGTFVMLSNTPNPTGGSNYLIPYTGDGRSGVYIWGGQIEYGITTHLTSYIPTPATFTSRSSTATYYDASGVIQTAGIDVARDDAYFPDENGVFKPAGLLLEGSITNLLTYSEQFDNAAWTKTNATITVNAAIAPDGTTTAEKLASSTGTWTTFIHQTFGGSGTRTLSVFAKASDSSWIAMGGIGSADETAYFNLSTGTIGTKQANVTNAAIKKFPNGWYRCSVTCDFQSYGGFVPVSGDNTLSIAPIGQGIYIWGAQLEASPYATSYIPTTTSTVTRAADVSSSSTVTRSADVAQITGSNFSSWYNQSESSLLVNWVARAPNISTPTYGLFGLGSNDNGVQALCRTTSFDVLIQNRSDGQGDTILPAYINSGPPQNVPLRLALGYQSGAHAVATEGVIRATSASQTFEVVSSLSIGTSLYLSKKLNGTISRLTYYPQRLSNTTLQKLTR